MRRIEKFYKDENYKYRHLRYVLTVEEAERLLKYLFESYKVEPILLKFQNTLNWDGGPAEGVFICPEVRRGKLELRFNSNEMEALTIIHEFSHYLQYKNEKWGYEMHGKGFYNTLTEVSRFVKATVIWEEV
jgi:hypothetical protein